MSSKYPTILKLKEKEAELEQDMNQYRALYSKYLQVVDASLKGKPINEGKFPYNVIRDTGQIGSNLAIDKQSCFRTCLDDNTCVYALYSNNKKDSKEPNVCKLYGATAGGLKKVQVSNVDSSPQRSCDGPNKCTISNQCPHQSGCDKHNECVMVNGKGRCLCVTKPLSNQNSLFPSISAAGGLSDSKTCSKEKRKDHTML